MPHTWRESLVSAAVVVAVLLPAPALAQSDEVQRLREQAAADHAQLEDELDAASTERLRNAERLTRLETLAEENAGQVTELHDDVTTIRMRMAQISDRISELLTTLLIGALTVIGILLPFLFALLRNQRTTRTEVREAKQQLDRTHEQVEHVVYAVNGGSSDMTGET